MEVGLVQILVIVAMTQEGDFLKKKKISCGQKWAEVRE